MFFGSLQVHSLSAQLQNEVEEGFLLASQVRPSLETLSQRFFCLFYLCISTSGRFFHPHFLYHLPWYYQQENSVVRYIFTTRCQSIRSKHILIFKSKHECRVMTQAQLLHHRPPICFQCASEAAKCPILCSQNGLRICSSVLLQ